MKLSLLYAAYLDCSKTGGKRFFCLSGWLIFGGA